ncbi:MAG: glutamate formimidoyltransferase [Caldilineaceae bacterium]|nr:glutamate formimidoyltransferase [Caldilineaceae bacterium]
MNHSANDIPIIEAVPNFSEGRRADVIDELAAAVRTSGARLLDRTSDPHHNRTVLTVAGPPEQVLQGLFNAVEVAVARIDLRGHRGVHPRLGAADVVPLVPVGNTLLADCALLARQLGRRIGDELDLPVYLYGEAAARAERRNLADVRRGEYEALVREIHLPQRLPDFGPAKVGPAGAVVVGARPVLIAFNVFLRSSELAVARTIARRIRERDGGLPAVRALGLLVDGQAQVSMNLVDYRVTTPHAAVNAIRRQAARHSVKLDRSELIGLIPQCALPGIGEQNEGGDGEALSPRTLAAAANALLLPELTPDRVLEVALRRLEAGIARCAPRDGSDNRFGERSVPC